MKWVVLTELKLVELLGFPTEIGRVTHSVPLMVVMSVHVLGFELVG